ncbi:N-acetylglucosaminyl transferase component-domain-containing protein [Gorgonomyces haynaldii]|nr:N-acetylglucosaminyl transferase component-domain-containing protein [Gorgonomyces haynaldii]
MIVFWPDNLRVDDKDCLMGYKTEDYLLIVKTQPDDQLELLGSCVVQRPSAPHYHFLIDPALGIPTGLYYDCELVEAFVFYFTPPKTNRLQYFSDRPLQLDLSGVHPSKDDFYLRNYSTYWSLLDPEPMIDYQELLKKINAVNGLQQMRQESHFDWHRIYTILSWICFIPRVLIELLLYLMNVPLPILRQPLRNLSKTIQQIDLRLQQLCFWPPQYFQWLERTEKLEPEAQAQYIGFWNTVWLIANDVILGIAIGATLVEFSDLFAETFSAILQHYDHQLDDIMTWLLNWPGGLKLNSELSSFFGDLYRWMLFAWRYTIETNASFIQLFLLLGGRCGVLGCTMILAILSDLITLSTLHLHLLYAVSCRIYYWQVSIMFSTFHLFQGRKYNPLRKRIDAAEYELDQTLIGAIIFTLLIFLLPTVGAYYLLFSIGRICVFMLLSVFEICLAILNHFPLFALLLRLKDPKRLPGRIYDGRTSLF